MQIAVVVATALAALANWWSRLRDDDRLELWTKPLTTVLVITLALASGAQRGDVIVAVVALALCLAGDVFLLPAVDRFVPGLAAFLLGHVVFIVLFVRYGLDSLALGATAAMVELRVDIDGDFVANMRADGLIIEVHPRPERALSDGAQSLTVAVRALAMRETPEFNRQAAYLRQVLETC